MLSSLLPRPGHFRHVESLDSPTFLTRELSTSNGGILTVDHPFNWYRILADTVVVTHLIFIVFTLLGGLLVIRWRSLVFLHIPAVLWAAWVEYRGWMCPLTPLENWFRQKAGMSGYSKSFIDQYLVPVIYPDSLNRDWQIMLGTLVIILNLTIYTWVWRRGQFRN